MAETVTTRATVRVEAPSGGYDVVIGRGLLDELGGRIAETIEGLDGAVLLVSDSNVGPLYARRVAKGIEATGASVRYVELPAGEATKSLASYERLLKTAAEAGLTRASAIVALGGGVVGDLAGFAAATYMRGCHLVQAATSLLAMVDSSVGGKTAVDLPQGKNLVGAFFQPDLVVADLDCLQTLPDEYLVDGLGEVAKYAVMCDPELFEWLGDTGRSGMGKVVERCVRIKRDVVEADERESGARKLLNLGHTVGHAIEALSGFRVSHGRAVAAGTAVMARACAAAGLCGSEDATRIESLLGSLGLPTATDRSAAEIAAAAARDKKRSGGCIDAVVVRGVGQTELRRMSLGEFERLIEGSLVGSDPANSAERAQGDGQKRRGVGLSGAEPFSSLYIDAIVRSNASGTLDAPASPAGARSRGSRGGSR